MTRDAYRLTPAATARATVDGLADADWYRTPVPMAEMQRLTRRTNVRPTLGAAAWLALLVTTAALAARSFGSVWALPAFAVYGTLYGGSADARWHEYGHGTAFRTGWPNQVLYYVASFLLLREPTMSRWTHVRHHSDTIVVGRDPEIILRRPPNLAAWTLNFANLVTGPRSLAAMARHATGKISDEEASYLPATEQRQVATEARCFLAILAAVTAACVVSNSVLPALLVGLPSFYGAWLVYLLNVTQHAGLPENILDHRYVARTMLLNPIGRFLYLNMNFHIEHHMFPAVPYHALPALHRIIRHDLPVPNRSLLAAYREIIPALVRQRHDPTYEIERTIPSSRRYQQATEAHTVAQILATVVPTAGERWVAVCEVPVDRHLLRADIAGRTYALYRLGSGTWHATDGICTHSRTVHLSTGTVIGTRIECPRHNGQFDILTGQPIKPPACKALTTHPVSIHDGWLHLLIEPPAGNPSEAAEPEQR